MEEQAQVDDDPLVGQSVGNYVVRSKLGEGGMGAVYLAEHPLIGKRVALKVLHPELTSKEEVKDRFFHEAKAVNDIQHPNIVDIVDFGEVKGQHPKDTMVYFIMEFLDGRALTEVIRNDAPVPEMRVRHLAMQIGDCLAASHKAGIVHRDLKPDNIMLVAKRHDPDFVKVLDFGIAKLTGDGHQSRKTRTGIVMGTPAYMSPEQCEGKGLIDHRTDVYALGIVIYEMLTGRVPFQGEG
ncbi:MAG: serine/threonine protein kinase, partial [Deltaproteobacteria bacterium]|nr:serine/threonine protein kinase [Deltaproteobacteria bacterium]